VRLQPQVGPLLQGSDQSFFTNMRAVSPVTGGAHEVMVQGKQTSGVLELLGSLGVPKKWIEVSEAAGKKRK
jgi:hypothetical protein